MEKKRKEKARSGKTNSNKQQVSSNSINIPQDRNNNINKNKSNSKKHSTQQFDDESNIIKDIQSNNILESDLTHNSRKQTKNDAKKKTNSKNNDAYKNINKQNKMLSPTNIIIRSRSDISYQSNRINLNKVNDFEENIRSNLNQSNSMDFSPILKKEARMSPTLTPYDPNTDYDIGKSLHKELDISDNLNDDDDFDSTHGNNSSFTQLFTSKCDLKAELQAAIQVNKQLKQRDANLQKRIQELNAQSQVALQVLEDRLSELRDENVRLLELLERLPSDERLIIEYNKLTTFPIEDEDIEPLINIGILEEGENITILKERLDDMIAELKYYELKYDIVAQYGEDGFMTKFFLSYFDDSHSKKDTSNSTDENSNDPNNEKLAKELKHKIDLLERSSDSSVKMARKKLSRLEKEVEMLRKDSQDQRNISTFQPTESSSTLLNQSGFFSLQDVKNVLVTAGGDKNNLKQIDGNTFSYKTRKKNEKSKEIKFVVEPICGRPYTQSSNSTKKISLYSFFKSII